MMDDSRGWPEVGLLNMGLAQAADRARSSLLRIASAGHGVGSGVAWSEPGIVVTNAHVAEHGRLSVVGPNGLPAEARLLALDREADAAVLAVEIDGLQPSVVGDARELRSGELVLALGFPWGITNAMTAGVVIGVEEGVAHPRLRQGQEWLVVNMRLRPGNSGGPIVDAGGKLVGLSTVMAGPEVGLAVPAHVVAGLVESVKAAQV